MDFNIDQLKASTPHAGARQWLLPRDPRPCPSTSSLTLMPFLHSSELFSGELAYFKPPAHKVTVSASRLHHIVFSPAFINLICVTLPTYYCTESAEIFGVSLSIWLMEGCYVRMSTFLRKKRKLFNLYGYKVKFEIVTWMFLFLRTRCLRLLKRERKFWV